MIISICHRYEAETKDQCNIVTEEECITVTKEVCKDFPEEVCKIVDVTETQNKCELVQKEEVSPSQIKNENIETFMIKCEDVLDVAFDTVEKTLWETKCKTVPDRECNLETVIKKISLPSTDCKIVKENKCETVIGQVTEKECKTVHNNVCKTVQKTVTNVIQVTL